MTVSQALALGEKVGCAPATQQEMLDWLSHLDQQVYLEIHSRFQPAPAPFTPYDHTTDPAAVLSIAPPFDDCYWMYLAKEMALAAGDLELYNQYLLLFASRFGEYAAWYCRSHRAI